MYMTHSKHLDTYLNEKMRPDLEPENPVSARPRAEYILWAAGMCETEIGGRSNLIN